jgi:hypothetical protein
LFVGAAERIVGVIIKYSLLFNDYVASILQTGKGSANVLWHWHEFKNMKK